MGALINFSGQRFGMLVVESRDGMMIVSGRDRAAWLCRCDCGGTRRVSSATLAKDSNLCCGCVQRLPGQELTLDWLFNRCIPEPNSGCWLWLGATAANGYGHIRYNHKLHTVHALSYQVAGGILLPGEVGDHLCRVPGCINPMHIEAVSPSENVLRGLRGTLRPIRTHCPNGHSYEDETRYEYGGATFCRQCGRNAGARYRAKKRQENRL